MSPPELYLKFVTSKSMSVYLDLSFSVTGATSSIKPSTWMFLSLSWSVFRIATRSTIAS